MDCLDLPIDSIRSLADVGHIPFQHLVWKTTEKALFALKNFPPPSLTITQTLRNLPLFPALPVYCN